MSASRLYFGMGCFWGVEKALKTFDFVTDTEVGFMGGTLSSPSYVMVCTGTTAHAEVVRVDFEAGHERELLEFFFENHDPTQTDGQGADKGTQYRSLIYTTTQEQFTLACEIRDHAQAELSKAGFGQIVTEIHSPAELVDFWPAEEYHQDYLEKNPDGYCPVHATGIKCG
ncbi:peptide-methionine (S)-S-oxide reductase MsrA [Actinomycetaceae bacterium TAE3-ERU4]|nr:peptide-methionine (S)-S-oxide reductase MsrA [Actinomycetaceae bacterium TAE3-ERU4]